MIVWRLSPLSPARTALLLNEMVCSLGRSKKWEMKLKMNNHHILSNTAVWQRKKELCPKETFSSDGKSKISLIRMMNEITVFTHLWMTNQNSKSRNHQSPLTGGNWHSQFQMIYNYESSYFQSQFGEDLGNWWFDNFH